MHKTRNYCQLFGSDGAHNASQPGTRITRGDSSQPVYTCYLKREQAQRIYAEISPTYGRSVNRYVPNLVAQLQELRDFPDYLGFYTGSHPDTVCRNFACQEHWQGMVRLEHPPSSRQHFLFASSHHEGSFLAVLDGGYRRPIGSNRLHVSKRDWDATPYHSTELFNSERIDAVLNHPGGMQQIGEFVAIGMEKIASGMPGKVVLYDIGEAGDWGRKPRKRWSVGIEGQKVAAAAIVKLKPLQGETSRRHLMVTAGPDSKRLTFNVSRLGRSLESTTAFSVSPQGVTTAEGSLTPASSTRWTAKYQTLQILVDASGELYLVSANKTETGGDDYIDLFRLELSWNGTYMTNEDTPVVSASVHHVLRKTMSCIPPLSGKMTCDFSSAATVTVDQDGRLSFYATVHDDDDIYTSRQWTRMAEFRPRDHLDNPDTVPVEGCSSMNQAWMNIYDGALTRVNGHWVPQGKGSLFIQFDQRHRRGVQNGIGYGSFSDANDFNDHVSTLQSCLPQGRVFRFFEHSGHTGEPYDIVGTGVMATNTFGNNGSRRNFSSGCFLNTSGACY